MFFGPEVPVSEQEIRTPPSEVAPSPVDLDGPKLYINRELSLLEFQRRVARGYRRFAELRPATLVVDGCGPVEEVARYLAGGRPVDVVVFNTQLPPPGVCWAARMSTNPRAKASKRKVCVTWRWSDTELNCVRMAMR